MKLNRKRFKSNLLLFAVLSLIICVLQVVAITIQPESAGKMQFIVGNEIYTFSPVMKFDRIIIAPSYIIFNSTGFHVFSDCPIKIYFKYLNSNILSANNGEKIVEFDATADNSLVLFILSGFPTSVSYVVNSDPHFFLYNSSKNFGYLIFFTNIHGTKNFIITKTY